jgi:hypothetical protein
MDAKPAVTTNGTQHHNHHHDAAAAATVVSKHLQAHNLSPTEDAEKRHDPETLEVDHVAEKKLVRKLDLFIIPPVMLLYLFVSTT